MNRKQRRAANANKRDGYTPAQGFGVAVPRVAGATPQLRMMVGEILRVLERYKPERLEGVDFVHDEKALAAFTVCAHFLACMPDSEHRRALIEEASQVLGVMVADNERAIAEAADLVSEIESEGGQLTVEMMEEAGAERLPDPPETDDRRPMFFLSTNRSPFDPQGEKRRLYYGRVFEMPGSEDEYGEETMRLEKEAHDQIDAYFANESPVDGGEIAIGEVVERYDVIDLEEQNRRWVMYRIPFRARAANDDRAREMPT